MAPTVARHPDTSAHQRGGQDREVALLVGLGFTEGTLLPEGERAEPGSRSGDYEQPHKGQLLAASALQSDVAGDRDAGTRVSPSRAPTSFDTSTGTRGEGGGQASRTRVPVAKGTRTGRGWPHFPRVVATRGEVQAPGGREGISSLRKRIRRACEQTVRWQ